MHPRNRTRLNLEALEDRAVPAAVITPNLLESDVADQAALLRRFAESFTRPATDGLNVVTLAELDAVSATPLPPSLQIFSAPGILSSGSVPQGQPGTIPALPDPSVSPAVDAQGFTGRLVLPGTGVQALVANGAGPLTQAPGLYLVGGSNPQPNDTAMAAPPAQAAEEEAGGAADGFAPDEVWYGSDWLTQTSAQAHRADEQIQS
jgi:hypothetical protein